MLERDPGVVDRIEEGMRVRTSDGADVGVVVHLWRGSDPAENLLLRSIQDRRMSYHEAIQLKQGVFLEVRPGVGGALYIPWGAVANVEEGVVALKVTEVAAGGSAWHEKPAWIGA